jgi:hypothetical protein
MFVCCECRVLSGRGLCDELITRPEESYRLWCVVVCDLENLENGEAMTHWGGCRAKKQTNVVNSGLGQFRRYCDLLRTGRYRVRIPMRYRFFRTCQHRPWDTPSIICKWYRVIPVDKAAGTWC